jgi:hypothetical protein
VPEQLIHKKKYRSNSGHLLTFKTKKFNQCTPEQACNTLSRAQLPAYFPQKHSHLVGFPKSRETGKITQVQEQ